MQIVISNLKVGKSKTQITVSDPGVRIQSTPPLVVLPPRK